MNASGNARRQDAASVQSGFWRQPFALESDLLRATEDYLRRRRDVWFTRVNAGSVRKGVRGARKGTADILACVRGGAFVGIELKAAKGKSSEDQVEFRETISKLGGVAVECRTLADVHAAVEGAMR